MKEEKDLSIQKLFWIFMFGCIIGYIIEVSFYVIKHGVFMNKQGLLYGPFKPIYGFGSVLITIILYAFRDKKGWVVFISGSVLGAVFEYLSSILLEYVFGTYMWNYSKMGLTINGRIFLPYIPIWGVISLCWLKLIYPAFNKFYKKIPKKPLVFVSIFCFIFMVYNISISSFAVNRLSERAHNIPAGTKFEKYLDRKYPDEYIYKRIPYLKIAD